MNSRPPEIAQQEDACDDLERYIAERTRKNPDFPRLMTEAAKRKAAHRTRRGS